MKYSSEIVFSFIKKLFANGIISCSDLVECPVKITLTSVPAYVPVSDILCVD